MCGTPEYLAPEIIVNKGYNHAVDWWAVGVLIYEMRCGKSPFEARSQLEMFKRISRRDFKFPRDYTPEEQELIGGLLQVGSFSPQTNLTSMLCFAAIMLRCILCVLETDTSVLVCLTNPQ
jgi:serine/threonine protein kinase